MTSTLLQRCRYVVTLDAGGTVHRDVDVLLAEGRVAGIGPDLGPADATLDCSRRIVMPGLVNLHTHLAMTLLRGLAEDVDLQGFLRRVFAAEGAVMDADTVGLGTSLGALESLRGGVTLANDMYFYPEAARLAAARAGLRLATGPVLFDFEGPDHRGWDARMADIDAWPTAARALGGPDAPSTVCPHSTYLVSPAHLTEINAAMRRWANPVLHTHISENLPENAQVAAQTGRTPTQVLADSGLLDGAFPVVFGHGVHLSDADLALAAGRAAVAHCPASNLKLASGALHWRRTADAGVALGIGTDGTSSSNDLDLWVAMRLAAMLARLTSGEPDAASSLEILRAATSGGAAALGMGDRLGMLVPGMDADVICLDADQPHLTPVHDVHALLVYAAGRGDVTDVFVAGERVVAHRESTLLDAEQLRARAVERGRAAAAAATGA